MEKTHTIQLRVSEAEKALIKEGAKVNGLPMSSYIRLALLNANLRALNAKVDKVTIRKAQRGRAKR
jgi:uncharacterized protein (DUF1778 family)